MPRDAALSFAADWMRATNMRTLTLAAAVKRLLAGLRDDGSRSRWAASAATPVFAALETVGLASVAGGGAVPLERALAAIVTGTPEPGADASTALPSAVLAALAPDDAAAVARCRAQLVAASHAVAALRHVASQDRDGVNVVPALHALEAALAASPLALAF